MEQYYIFQNIENQQDLQFACSILHLLSFFTFQNIAINFKISLSVSRITNGVSTHLQITLNQFLARIFKNEIFLNENLSILVYRDNRLANKHLYFPKLHLHKL